MCVVSSRNVLRFYNTLEQLFLSSFSLLGFVLERNHREKIFKPKGFQKYQKARDPGNDVSILPFTDNFSV